MTTATQEPTTHRLPSGRISWSEADVAALHSYVKDAYQNRGKTITQACDEFARKLRKQVPGIQGPAASSRFYMHDARLPASERVVDTRRSRAAVKSARVRMKTKGKPSVKAEVQSQTQAKAPAPKLRVEASANGHAKTPVLVAQLTDYVAQLEAAKTAAERRAADAEKRAEKLASKLKYLHRLTA